MYSCSRMCKDVFKRHKSSGRRLFAFWGSGFAHIWGQNVSIRVKTLSNTNLVVSSHVLKGENASFLLTCVAQESLLLNLPNIHFRSLFVCFVHSLYQLFVDKSVRLKKAVIHPFSMYSKRTEPLVSEFSRYGLF